MEHKEHNWNDGPSTIRAAESAQYATAELALAIAMKWVTDRLNIEEAVIVLPYMERGQDGEERWGVHVTGPGAKGREDEIEDDVESALRALNREELRVLLSNRWDDEDGKRFIYNVNLPITERDVRRAARLLIERQGELMAALV